MQADWKEFLRNNGAAFGAADGVLGYGDTQAELRAAVDGTVCADLSQHAVLAVRGADAEAFLQGQFTNDVKHLDADHSQLNGYCSPKGRLLATFRVWRDDDGFLLSMPRVMLDPVSKRLRMFVLRSAVALEDVSDRQVRLGIAGPGAAALLQNRSAMPAAIDGISRATDLTVLRLPGVQPRFEVHGPLPAMTQLWDALKGRCTPVGAAAWELTEMLAGIPAILPETADAFVPQMVNFQRIGGVSFKKGCYPGQEVVARMQYLGKLKRQMYLARVDAPSMPHPGDDVYAADDPEQSAGKVVNVQPHPDGGYLLLTVVQIASRDNGSVRLGDARGPEVAFEALPYALDEAS